MFIVLAGCHGPCPMRHTSSASLTTGVSPASGAARQHLARCRANSSPNCHSRRCRHVWHDRRGRWCIIHSQTQCLYKSWCEYQCTGGTCATGTVPNGCRAVFYDVCSVFGAVLAVCYVFHRPPKYLLSAEVILRSAHFDASTHALPSNCVQAHGGPQHARVKAC